MKKVPGDGELSENTGLGEGERAAISFSSERGHSNLQCLLCPPISLPLGPAAFSLPFGL
jgi:hypothetical protein